ncbi:phosphotransferase [Nonomuraea sp. NPDC050404]|uniref:phosphotransferase n=1 Tax=Nonomuraea sp. NPDC050404 TaxID=3155783 RepID=UPI003402794B
MTERSPAELAAALCDLFGLEPAGADITPVGRGAMGRVWRLTAGGAAYAVKEHLWGVDERAVARGAALQQAAAAAGVRSPRNVPTPGGGLVGHLPAALGGSGVRLYDWQEGPAARPDEAETPERLGELLARLHGLAMAAPDPPHPWYETLDEVDWERLAGAAAARRPWQERLAASLPDLRRLASLVTPSEPDDRIMCHLDVQGPNVVRTDRGWVLLDWDDTGAGCADRELAMVLLRWFTADGVDGAAIGRTMAAYRAAGGTAVLEPERSFAMQAASCVNFVAAQARLALDDEHAEHHADAEERLMKVLATLPEVATYREVARFAAAGCGGGRDGGAAA